MKWKDWDTNIKVRLIGEFFVNLLFWMFFPFMAIYFSDELGKETAGILLVLSQIVGVITNLVGGYCADRYGRKKMMVISAWGQAVTFVFFVAANSPWLDSPVLTFIAFSALGLFGSLYWPASHAMIADVVEEKNRSEVFAVFYTSINISVVFGPILGSIFFFSYRFELLLACLLVSIVLAFVLAKYIRETVPVKKEILEQVGTEKKWNEAVWAQLKDYRVIASDKLFLLFVLAGILVAQTFMQMDLLLAVYTTEKVPEQTLIALGNWDFSLTGEKVFGYLISLNGLLVALCTVWIAKWMNRFNEGRVFILSTMLYGVSMLVFGGTTIMWVLFGAMVIFTTAELMVVGIQESFISKLAPENMRGQYFAAAGLRFSIGRTIAPITIPLTMWIGFHNTFYLLFLLALISAGIYFIMFRAFEKKGQPASNTKTDSKPVVS
ncbi:MDR family MFS transporter [Fictibacillus barbaricus]|uniref:MFS family permease n=1 Tax=Fictibacillus barbaricus TaxID=182136 RepID=A0ABU1TVA7_9BACL|nr:MFS transporter [Fictibacillus barbaricus]MDR7071139.1 MFS family permease [Fictibacillus barbaricus]